jgi:hypothetical protein
MTRQLFKTLPIAPTHDMIEAAYMLIETMPKGTPERHKRIVMQVWEEMIAHAPKPKPSGLTRLQQRTHEAIADFIDEHGLAPSYEEVARQLGKTKSHTHQIIHALRRRGVITFREGHKRTIQLICRPGEPIPPYQRRKLK